MPHHADGDYLTLHGAHGVRTYLPLTLPPLASRHAMPCHALQTEMTSRYMEVMSKLQMRTGAQPDT